MSKTDYAELSRRSIRKDFAKANFVRNGRAPKVPHTRNTRRVVELATWCEYYRFRRFFENKLVRILRPASAGGYWVSFINDRDRDALNKAGQWNEKKCEYLLYGVRFDE